MLNKNPELMSRWWRTEINVDPMIYCITNISDHLGQTTLWPGHTGARCCLWVWVLLATGRVRCPEAGQCPVSGSVWQGRDPHMCHPHWFSPQLTLSIIESLFIQAKSILHLLTLSHLSSRSLLLVLMMWMWFLDFWKMTLVTQATNASLTWKIALLFINKPLFTARKARRKK